jgi:hypothetical protein
MKIIYRTYGSICNYQLKKDIQQNDQYLSKIYWFKRELQCKIVS